MEEGDWTNGSNKSIAVLYKSTAEDAVFLWLMNAADTPVEFTLPDETWALALSSDPDQKVADAPTSILVRDRSFTLLQA